MYEKAGFWPGGARLAVTISMPFGDPLQPAAPEMPDRGRSDLTEYGTREGVLRLLDLLDKHNVTMTTFMVGDAVRRQPKLAAAIVARGHEAAAHARVRPTLHQCSQDEERTWIRDCFDAIGDVTGARAAGYHDPWADSGANARELLQDLQFTYQAVDSVAGEPVLQLDGRPFATVPVLFKLGGGLAKEAAGFSPRDYEDQLIDEFDQLYEEGSTRRRMMAVGLNQQLAGRAGRVRVLDRILARLREHDDVWFARNDEVVQWVLSKPRASAWVDRDGMTGEMV